MHLNFYVAVPIVVLLAAGVGVLIGAPVLRLRGDYLAIVTLGFGEIARVIFGSNWPQPLFGGPQGHAATSPTRRSPGLLVPTTRSTSTTSRSRSCLLAIFVSWRLASSRIGRAWNAMREDEQVADAMGISTTRFKLLAFAIGGAIGSLGGALFAVKHRLAHARELRDPRLDHRARDRHPRRAWAASPAWSWARWS